MSTNDIELNSQTLKEVFDAGIDCEAEIEVGEACECIIYVMQQVEHTQMYKNLKLGLSSGVDLDKVARDFVVSVTASLVATLTANFKDRERAGNDA